MSLLKQLSTPPTSLGLKVRLQLKRAFYSGDVFAYPTESVFGLGCDPWCYDAVMKLLAIKQRPLKKGLIVVAGHMDQIEPLLTTLSIEERRRLESTWPGPVTWSLPHNHFFPDYVTGGRETVAVRISSHPVVQRLIQNVGHPIISTSANPTGRPPARTALKCRCYFGQDMLVVPGQVGGLKNPTPIRDVRTGHWYRQ